MVLEAGETAGRGPHRGPHGLLLCVCVDGVGARRLCSLGEGGGTTTTVLGNVESVSAIAKVELTDHEVECETKQVEEAPISAIVTNSMVTLFSEDKLQFDKNKFSKMIKTRAIGSRGI